MNAQDIVQLTCSGASFAHLADDLSRGLRERLFVPEHADDDVEAEFSAFRVSLDAYYPEFCELFASALVCQLGQDRMEGMLRALSAESAQRYLAAAGQIERELEQSMPRLSQELTATARAALSGSAALSSGHPKALSLARATGAHDVLQGLAQAVTRQVLSGRGDTAADPMPMESPKAQRIQSGLLGKLVGFYARSFIRHVGEQHAAAIVEELHREPLFSYVRARSAMRPVLERGLQELVIRMLKVVF